MQESRFGKSEVLAHFVPKGIEIRVKYLPLPDNAKENQLEIKEKSNQTACG